MISKNQRSSRGPMNKRGYGMRLEEWQTKLQWNITGIILIKIETTLKTLRPTWITMVLTLMEVSLDKPALAENWTASWPP